MIDPSKHDAWGAGESYEQYMGRWSRQVAGEFVALLDRPPGLHWVDVGCGTGALTGTILERCAPASIVGIDPSPGFIGHARTIVHDSRVFFVVADAGALPCADRSADMVVSGLAYNFFPERARALREMSRVARPGGTLAVYVWDYPGGGVGFVNAFWDAAVSFDPGAAEHLESKRFQFCTADVLVGELREAGLGDLQVDPIRIRVVFRDFEDFWRPFTLGAGPAPGYYLQLDVSKRETLRQCLESRLGTHGTIEFSGRAWALRGRSDR